MKSTERERKKKGRWRKSRYFQEGKYHLMKVKIAAPKGELREGGEAYVGGRGEMREEGKKRGEGKKGEEGRDVMQGKGERMIKKEYKLARLE